MDFSSLPLNYKFRVTPTTSIKLQQFLFNNDLGQWRINNKICSHIEAPYLYLSESKSLAFGRDSTTFNEDTRTEITVEDFIKLVEGSNPTILSQKQPKEPSMPPTLKPIHEMDEDHLINTVNNIEMDIERRRACLLELRKRFNPSYLYAAGYTSAINSLPIPTRIIYDCRFFLDDWNYEEEERIYTLPHTVLWASDLINALKRAGIDEGTLDSLYFTTAATSKQEQATGAEKPIKKTKTKQQTKEQTMLKTIKDTAVATLAQNKQTFTVAAQVTAGRTVNQQLIKAIKPKMPMMLRGYADHPIASILLANATAFAIKQYMPTNNKANILADCMMQAAAIDTMDSFNIEDMVNDFISNLSLPTGIFGEEEETIPAPKGRTRGKAKTE